jgi:two-component system, OmpR family, response regulator VicR
MTKLLVIDDEDDIRLALRALLESNGYEVEEASTGQKGLDLLKETKIDLVICDFFMPMMNGRQVIETMHKNPKLKDIKVILLTVASFGRGGEEKLKELEVAAYMQKPFENQELLAKIRELLA